MQHPFIKIGFIVFFLAFINLTQAATTGAYFYFGGGGLYLEDGKLGNTTITHTNLDPFRHVFSIAYAQKGSFDFLGRAAFGYLFKQSPCATHGFGIEAGYSYFVPINSSVSSSLVIPLINVNHGVTSTEKTRAWATDLQGIYRKTFVHARANIFVKFGMGYENMTNKITNTVAALPNELPHHVTLGDNGVGVTGGIGFEFSCSKHIGLRFEIDGLKGGKGVGYGQALVGFTLFT
jgi:hypothetical protein